MISVLVILVTILSKKEDMKRLASRGAEPTRQVVSGMISRIGNVSVSSARRGASVVRAMRVRTDGDTIVCPAHRMIPNAPSSFTLYGGMQDKVPEEIMSRVADRFVRDSTSQNGVTLNMFFAPWCSHCQETLRALSNMGKDSRYGGVKLNIVNGSALSEKALRGNVNGIPEIAHYPTFYSTEDGFTRTYGSLSELLQSNHPSTGQDVAKAPQTRATTNMPKVAMAIRSVTQQMDMRNMFFQNDRLMDGPRNKDTTEMAAPDPTYSDPLDEYF